MEKLTKKKKLYRILAISSVVSGAISIPGLIFSIVMLWYVPIAVCTLLIANGFYGSPFYFIAASNAFRTELILAAMQEGITDIGELAKRGGVTEELARKLIDKSKSKSDS